MRETRGSPGVGSLVHWLGLESQFHLPVRCLFSSFRCMYHALIVVERFGTSYGTRQEDESMDVCERNPSKWPYGTKHKVQQGSIWNRLVVD